MTSFTGQFSFIILTHFITLFLCFSDNIVTVGTTDIDFDTLTLTSLKLLGDAHLSNGSVRLTNDLSVPNSGAGMVLYSKPVRFRRKESNIPTSFSTFFSFSVTNLNPSSIGGGLAFVIIPDDDSVGDAGGYLGFMDQKGNRSGVLAVEFDTLMDVEFKDINGNHVGLDLNSMVSTRVSDLETVNVDLKSGDLVNSWVDYSGSTQVFNISVSYSNLKPKEPLLSFTFDLHKYVNDFMFVGFSGSTQGSTEIHSIEWWSFNSSFDLNSKSGASSSSTASSPPPPTATFINATANSVKPPPPPPSLAQSTTLNNTQEKKNSKCYHHNHLCKETVIGVVISGTLFLAFCALIVIWFYLRKFKYSKTSETLTSDMLKMPKEFSYKELKLATKGFNPTRIIGHGAFGTVFKAILPESGGIVAVKRCSHIEKGKSEFLSELSIIGTLRHRNLVKLQGWCHHENGEILLVYDLMTNGSLDKALFESKMVLPWTHRHKILLNIASALTYLHQECENQVIHRDIKTSNIMLDEDFNAKLGDFGLAKQIEHDKSPEATAAAGTMGYLAPEYLLTGRATEKTDVFSYGAVVLEVVSGRRPIEKTPSTNLVEWVWSLHREGKLLMAVDSRLEDYKFEEREMMRKVLLIGLVCSHPDPMARPTMRGVVQMLVGEAEIPNVPTTKPCMSFNTSHLLMNLQDSVSDLMINISTFSSSSSSEEEQSFSGGLHLV